MAKMGMRAEITRMSPERPTRMHHPASEKVLINMGPKLRYPR